MASGNGGDKATKLIGLGQMLLGGSLIVKGFLNMRAAPESSADVHGLADARARQAKLPEDESASWKGRIIGGVKFYRVGDIDERVSYIKKMCNKGSLHPFVRETAENVLTRVCGENYCVKEKDYVGEVTALFYSVRNPKAPEHIRYIRDHVKVDQFKAADKTLKTHAGDCDDYAITLGAMLMATGYPVKFRVVQAKDAPTWSHIYLLAGTPPTNPSRWIPLDASVVTAKPGWEVQGARETAQTGRPHSYIERVRDYDV